MTWCDANRVLVAVYPPHSTHRLQSLDVSLFSPLAAYYTQELDQWMTRIAGLSSVSKMTFSKLFWPAFQRAFVERDVLSGWEKTGLQPFNPNIVLDQVTPDERPSTGTTGSSAVSNLDWKGVRGLVHSAVGMSITKEARKLVKTVDQLQARNAILEAKVADLQETVYIEKGKRKRGKPLFDLVGPDTDSGAMFFSPNKIQEARARQQANEATKQAEETAKIEDKMRKEQEEKEQQQLTAQRKEQRKEIARQKRVERTEKTRLRKEAANSRAAAKQFQLDVQKTKKDQLNDRAMSKRQKQKSDRVNQAQEEEVVVTRLSRYGRQLKDSKQFDL